MRQDKPLRTSWQKKMQEKAELKNLKSFEAELKEAKNEELEVRPTGFPPLTTLKPHLAPLESSHMSCRDPDISIPAGRFSEVESFEERPSE